MKYRKLRIAWSVIFGTPCLLLIVFWNRSYFQNANHFYSIPYSATDKVLIQNWQGELTISLSSTPRADGVSYPHSWPVLFLLIATALPWLPSRFSLRTLLIATTLVAVLLGGIVWLSR